MCGIIAKLGGRPPRPGQGTAGWRQEWGELCHARDSMAYRGPDGAGLAPLAADAQPPWAVLGHRRLAVVAPGDEGAQPMRSACGRYAITYNGELYNDAELRRDLAALGVAFRTRSDTETLLQALISWGESARMRLRGMYAFVFVDIERRCALAGRDELGIKPLCVAQAADGAIVLASEPRAAAFGAGLTPALDTLAAAHYLVSIRTTLDRRTLWAGVDTLRPGEWVAFDDTLRTRRIDAPIPARVGVSTIDDVRAAVEDSVRRHLRADVPISAMLSGGLDSTIIAALASRELGTLDTYCSGDAHDVLAPATDFAMARFAAARLGTRHHEVPVTRDEFCRTIPALIEQLGTPLGTPNEVAIAAVAARVARAGHKVLLSGEGADELFGGYESTLAAGVRSLHPRSMVEDSLHFWLHEHAWVPADVLPEVLHCADEGTVEALRDSVRDVLTPLAAAVQGRSALRLTLAYQRRVNLEGLLRRLDSSTMARSVEGRTPLADAELLRVADGLPDGLLFDGRRGKVALREAFKDVVPLEVCERPKASFPLPIDRWAADVASVLRDSPWAADTFGPRAVAHAISNDPTAWRLAWPMANLTHWACAMGLADSRLAA